MQPTNRGKSAIVQFEHDYSRNGVEDSEENLFGQKLRRFGAVDRWTDRLLVGDATGGDWHRIIDRETAILKVQCPFLPPQQLRGKAYRKFGVPAVMGAVLSSASAIFGGSKPEDLPKARKKNASRMSRSLKVAKLESLEEFEKNDEDVKAAVLRCESRIVREKSADIETRERIINVVSDDSESPTPDFAFAGEIETLSIFSKPTQKCEENSWASQVKIETNVTPTQIATPNLRSSENQAVIDHDLLGEISSKDREIRRPDLTFIVSPNCSQIVVQIFPYVDFEEKNSPEKTALSTSISPSPTSSSSAGRSGKKIASKENQASSLFDTVDIDDLTQLPTPGAGGFEIQSKDFTSPSRFRSRETPEIFVPRIASSQPEMTSRKNLKRKRNSNVIRVDDSDEDKENSPTKGNFQGEKTGKNLALGAFLPRPKRLDENENIFQASEIPKSKRRRLDFGDEISPPFVTENCGLTPFPRSREKTVEFVDVDEKKKSRASTSRSAIELRDDQVSPSFVIEDCGLTPFPLCDRKKSVRFVSLSDDDDAISVEEILSVDESEKNLTQESSVLVSSQESKSKKNSSSAEEKRGLESQTQLDSGDEISPPFMTENCGLTPFLPRYKKKSVQFVDLSNEDDAAIISEVCDEIPILKIDCEEDSSPDSSATYFSGANAREFLSDRCCEFDQRLQSEDLRRLDAKKNSILERSFMDRFKVPMTVINGAVDGILKFLDSDIENN